MMQTGTNPIHPLARLHVVSFGDVDNQHMSWRRSLLLMAGKRRDGSCVICDGTGRYTMPESYSAFRWDRSGEKPRKVAGVFARFAAAVPCWNPKCTAPKPDNACPRCRGIGQLVKNGELTDVACMACQGFGHVHDDPLGWLDEALDELTEAVPA